MTRSGRVRMLVTALAVLAAGCSGGSPGPGASTTSRFTFPFVIGADKAAPAQVDVGDTVHLYGNYFGKATGSVVLRKAGNKDIYMEIGKENILSWSDAAIDFRIPVKDSSGQTMLSTNPIIGSVTVGITRADDDMKNWGNTDLQGREQPVTLQLQCNGLANVVADLQGHGFSGMSILYRLVSPGGPLTRALPFSSLAKPGDLTVVLKGPARTDYQAAAVIYAGPLDTEGRPTGDVLLETSPKPVQLLPLQPIDLSIVLPCDDYAVCSVVPTPIPGTAPSAAPGGGGPSVTPTAPPPPSPTPSPSLPPGVQPETVLSYGSINTLVGLGTSRSIPTTQTFSKDTNVGLPWGIQYDSKGYVHFVMVGGGLARQSDTPAKFDKLIDPKDNVAGNPLGFLMVFDFVPPNDDLVLSDKESRQVSQGRVVYIPKVNGAYAISQAYNLNFGAIKVEQPSAVQYHKGKLYVASTDDTNNGPGASYIVEYDLATKASRIVAGNGTPGWAGDGGPATQARISPIDIGFGPVGTALEGLMVIADGGTNALRAVNLNASGSIDFHGTVIQAGNIATIAGKNSNRWNNGDLTTFPGEWGFHSYAFVLDKVTGGFSGDGGLATEAQLDWPFDPRFDSKGRLYFADADNHRLRVIDRNGVMQTLVGSVNIATNANHRGFNSPSGKNIDKASQQNSIPNGDGGDPRNGDINHPMDMHLREEPDGSITFWIGETDSLRYRVVSGLRWAN